MFLGHGRLLLCKQVMAAPLVGNRRSSYFWSRNNRIFHRQIGSASGAKLSNPTAPGVPTNGAFLRPLSAHWGFYIDLLGAPALDGKLIRSGFEMP